MRPTCETEGCNNKAEAIGEWFKKKCSSCKKGRTPENRKKTGGQRRMPKGSRKKNKAGYITIDGKLEHRLVMEQHYGRPLEKGENVHHINGIRDDNSIGNLELWRKPQPTGIRVEDLVRDVVRLYPEMVRDMLWQRDQVEKCTVKRAPLT